MIQSLIALLFALLTTSALAKPADVPALIGKMSSDVQSEREAATNQLLAASATQLPEVASALFKTRRAADLDLRIRLDKVLNQLYDLHVLKDGAVSLGVTWGWHIQMFRKGEMRARPIVESIKPDSPAKAAGLKVGDIVCYVNKKELPRQDGLLAFRRLLAANEGGTLKLTVRASKLEGKIKTSKPAPPRTITVPVKGRSEKVSKERSDGRKLWMRDLRALYDS